MNLYFCPPRISPKQKSDFVQRHSQYEKQIIIIHGGDAFNTYEEYLAF